MGVRDATEVQDPQKHNGIVGAYARYREELVRFASVLVGADDAHDVVSSAMLRLLDRAVTIDNPKAYLYQAVANQARNHKRGEMRRLRREEMAAVWESPVTAPEPYPEVRAAIQALSIRQRAVVYLIYWDDLSERDVAECLGIRPGSVRRHLARARKHLRRALRDYES